MFRAPPVLRLGPGHVGELMRADERLEAPIVIGEDEVFGPQVSGYVTLGPDGVDGLEDLIENLECPLFVDFIVLDILLKGA